MKTFEPLISYKTHKYTVNQRNKSILSNFTYFQNYIHSTQQQLQTHTNQSNNETKTITKRPTIQTHRNFSTQGKRRQRAELAPFFTRNPAPTNTKTRVNFSIVPESEPPPTKTTPWAHRAVFHLSRAIQNVRMTRNLLNRASVDTRARAPRNRNEFVNARVSKMKSENAFPGSDVCVCKKAKKFRFLIDEFREESFVSRASVRAIDMSL